LTAARRPASAAGPEILHRAEALAATLPPLMVAARRVAATATQGVHGRRRVGAGETFLQFRRYHPGDPAQRIDWRRSARSHRVYVRQTEWEAAQTVWLWRDASPSMAWRATARGTTKRERADLLLLALASLLARGGEHMALIGGGSGPAARQAALHRLVLSLEGSPASDEGLPPVEPLPRYGRLVLFGDLLAPIDDIKAVMTAYAARGLQGHWLQILDPAEETLPFGGRVRFEGLEDDGEALIGRVEDIRDRYRRRLDAHREAISAHARALGWTFAVHHTDGPPQPALLGLYLALSERRW
jgi:uncharacterized protein (DUF58 family)